MTELDHVVVLAGGLSPERDVSLRSGRRVRDALEEAGVDARIADADAALIPALLADPPTAVFPAIHGSYGEDGAIREILALVGVPYVGSVASACRSAFDKPTAKALVAAAGITTPESVTLPREIFHDLGATAVIDRIIARLGLPLFVKPARGGSSLGASPVRTAAELPTSVVSCFAYGDTAFIERFIEGTEIAVSVVDLGHGPYALPGTPQARPRSTRPPGCPIPRWTRPLRRRPARIPLWVFAISPGPTSSSASPVRCTSWRSTCHRG